MRTQTLTDALYGPHCTNGQFWNSAKSKPIDDMIAIPLQDKPLMNA